MEWEYEWSNQETTVMIAGLIRGIPFHKFNNSPINQFLSLKAITINLFHKWYLFESRTREIKDVVRFSLGWIYKKLC